MKKGFTLIEILAVIALLGILITLTSISIITFKNNSDESLKKQKIKYIETGALNWGEDHLNSLNGVCNYVHISELINGGYITGDNEEKDALLVPGTSETFNNKCVCVKYENVYSGNIENASYKDANGSTHQYNETHHGNTKYQVIATYGEGVCN